MKTHGLSEENALLWFSGRRPARSQPRELGSDYFIRERCAVECESSPVRAPCSLPSIFNAEFQCFRCRGCAYYHQANAVHPGRKASRQEQEVDTDTDTDTDEGDKLSEAAQRSEPPIDPAAGCRDVSCICIADRARDGRCVNNDANTRPPYAWMSLASCMAWQRA